VYQEMGRLDDALRHHEAALRGISRAGDRHVEGFIRISHGETLEKLGSYEAAARSLESSVAICREYANGTVLAQALAALGTVHSRRGDPAAAAVCWVEATALCETAGSPKATEVRALLDALGPSWVPLTHGEAGPPPGVEGAPAMAGQLVVAGQFPVPVPIAPLEGRTSRSRRWVAATAEPRHDHERSALTAPAVR
jgi:tetratricopeptide (TPR) repeat protein